MTVEHIYQSFAVAELAHNEPLILIPTGSYNWDLCRPFDCASFEIVDYGKTFPRILFDFRGSGIRYGEFMDALYRKGEENGWDYLYRLNSGSTCPGPIRCGAATLISRRSRRTPTEIPASSSSRATAGTTKAISPAAA